MHSIIPGSNTIRHIHTGHTPVEWTREIAPQKISFQAAHRHHMLLKYMDNAEIREKTPTQ